jgi:hypothetical protein
MAVLIEDRFWDEPLDRPIEIGQGDQCLATLGDVGTFILDLPEALQRQHAWRVATDIVLEAARSGDLAPVTMAVHMALMLSGHNARSVWNDGVDSAEGSDDFPRSAELLGLGRRRVPRA